MNSPTRIGFRLEQFDTPSVFRGLALAGFLLSMAFVGFLKNAASIDTAGNLVMATVTQHKIVWFCLGVAAWHLQRQRLPLRTVDLLAMGPAALFIMIGWGSWPWLGLVLSLVLLLCLTQRDQQSRRCGLSIGLAVALHEGLMPIFALIAGDTVLALDARIAGSLAQLFVEELSMEGTTLRSTGGHSVVLVWGCSSLSQLGNAMLFCWSLCSLTAAPQQSRSLVLMMFVALTALMAIAINTLRLSLLAVSPDMFNSLHDGLGATLFRLTILGVAMLAAFGYQRQCRGEI